MRCALNTIPLKQEVQATLYKGAKRLIQVLEDSEGACVEEGEYKVLWRGLASPSSSVTAKKLLAWSNHSSKLTQISAS